MIGFSENITDAQALWLPELVDQVFKQNGLLQSNLELEFRPQQAAMATRVSQSMAGDTPLVFEAGTGVGKSLAYLIPGILHAYKNERKMIVSTHTIALQEQILSKDLKLCKQLFDVTEELSRFSDFKSALLIGKRNYLCTRRLQKAVAEKSDLFDLKLNPELERIVNWSKETEKGIIQELYPLPAGEVWDWVNADSSQCSRHHCSPETCFYQKAKKQIQDAHIIIINHSLLFALLSAGLSPGRDTRGILFPDDFLILDEAHTVPDIATEHFGLSVTNYAVHRALTQIFNPKNSKGLIAKYPSHEAKDAVVRAMEYADEFFERVNYEYLQERSILRLHKSQWTENTLALPLQAVADQLGRLAQKETNEQSENELKDSRQHILTLKAAIENAIELESEEQVYWLEKSGKKQQVINLRSAPVDVAPYLSDFVMQRNTHCLMTSATLSDAEGLDRFKAKAGAQNADSDQETSPFDFPNRMLINIAADSPEPDPNSKKFETEYLADSIEFAVSRVSGGTLVLFTSYEEMNRVATPIRKALSKLNRTFLIQGGNYSRSDLVKEFKKAGDAVLFGTDSFWTGVDVPGPALSQVILVRLPFENPSHPIQQARSEACIERGEKPFFSLSLPAAQIKFRQGIGRLIRNHQDKGVITLLDSRVLRKSYGQAFIQILPHTSYSTFTRFNRESKFQSFASR